MWSFLAGVAAIDERTVEFTLKRPYTPGLLYVGEQAIVAEHKWKDVANPVEFDDPSPVGTGPFVEVLRFDPTVYELGRNKTYWQPGKPTVDVLRVPLFRSNEEITRALPPTGWTGRRCSSPTSRRRGWPRTRHGTSTGTPTRVPRCSSTSTRARPPSIRRSCARP